MNTIDKKLFIPLILANCILTSCGDSSFSDLKERTGGLIIETQSSSGPAVRELMALIAKAEPDDPDSVEDFISAMTFHDVLAHELSYSAEMAKWQIYADWLAFGIEQGSDVCSVALDILNEQKKSLMNRSGDIRTPKDYALLKISLEDDDYEINARARRAYKRLLNIPENNLSELKKEIIQRYTDIQGNNE